MTVGVYCAECRDQEGTRETTQKRKKQDPIIRVVAKHNHAACYFLWS